MSSNLPASLSESDYEAIEQAVMETARGRWFLAEYARRNRHADTNSILDAIDRLQQNINAQKNAETLEGLRQNLLEISQAIEITRVEVQRLHPKEQARNKIDRASGELHAIVQATEEATFSILNATERMEERLKPLKHQGVAAEELQALEACIAEIYATCGFQDITAQRTGKVITALTFVETRIKAMTDAWGVPVKVQPSHTASMPAFETHDGDELVSSDHFWPSDPIRQAAIDITLSQPIELEATTVTDRNDTTAKASEVSAPSKTGAFTDLDHLSALQRLKLFA